jgi:hypothetical protein
MHEYLLVDQGGAEAFFLLVLVVMIGHGALLLLSFSSPFRMRVR